MSTVRTMLLNVPTDQTADTSHSLQFIISFT